MTFTLKPLLLFTFLLLSCNSGKLDIIAYLPNNLKEASAIETVVGSDLLWTIEDAGNKNNIYGLNRKGEIIKDIDVDNAKNIDWEDLTSDNNGNLYIGDFGNNNKKRKNFSIYKISNLRTNDAKAERINFILPKKVKPEDFEAFFLLNNNFYVFSKEKKSSIILKIPNRIGKHTAKVISKFKLKGKDSKITGAAINKTGKIVVLLNHDKLWKITNFKEDNFLNGHVEALEFNHNSQKEGVCFKSNSVVYITDEKNGNDNGIIYEFKID